MAIPEPYAAEGLADYLALQIHPGGGVGPNPNGYAASGRIPAQIVDHLGTARPAPAWLATDMSYRRAYYYASYRFVKSLVETAGMEVFLQLHDATDPETEIVRLYGATREELIRRAGM